MYDKNNTVSTCICASHLKFYDLIYTAPVMEVWKRWDEMSRSYKWLFSSTIYNAKTEWETNINTNEVRIHLKHHIQDGVWTAARAIRKGLAYQFRRLKWGIWHEKSDLTAELERIDSEEAMKNQRIKKKQRQTSQSHELRNFATHKGNFIHILKTTEFSFCLCH